MHFMPLVIVEWRLKLSSFAGIISIEGTILICEADEKFVLMKSWKIHICCNVLLPNFIYLNRPCFLKALRKFSINSRNYCGITHMCVHEMCPFYQLYDTHDAAGTPQAWVDSLVYSIRIYFCILKSQLPDIYGCCFKRAGHVVRQREW